VNLAAPAAAAAVIVLEEVVVDVVDAVLLAMWVGAECSMIDL
jgi:hypothetical protein